MQPGQRALLARHMSLGVPVLFLGAGFSVAATNRLDQPVPSGAQLKEQLWRTAFPSRSHIDARSTLQDVYASAVAHAQGAVGRLLRDVFTIPTANVPEVYRLWLSMPWFRIYTLNVDNLVEATDTRYQLPRSIRSVSALTDGVVTSGDLLCIHLNGRVEDFPRVTFSDQQYGERTATTDIWLQQLAADLAGHPFVFVGTELDEPPLWHHVAMRGIRNKGVEELRPRSYLVTPDLALARRDVVGGFNVDWIAATQESFAAEVLVGMEEARLAGLAALNRQHILADSMRSLHYVSDLRQEPPRDDLSEYLLGRTPHWSDVTVGYAVPREFEAEIHDALAGGAQIVILTGTAGCGRTTTLMQAAIRIHNDGREVAYVDNNTEMSPNVLRRAIRNSTASVVVIDDVERYGHYTAGLLQGVAQDDPQRQVIAAIRATAVAHMSLTEQLADIPTAMLAVPNLEDSDIDSLLDALSATNRLGKLRNKTRSRQAALLSGYCGRQLLVSMIEATFGERFDVKIDRECEEIGPRLGRIYATVALATANRYSMGQDEIMLAIGRADNEARGDLQGLADRKLLVTDGQMFSVRHRVIADRVVEFYRTQGQLVDSVRGLLFSMATRVGPTTPRNHRSRRLLIRLMNHDWLGRRMKPGDVRRVYDQLESVLSDDYHYFLQRGTYEVKMGNLRLARNFLAQAREMAPDDHLVLTEYATLELKQAVADPGASGAQEAMEAALAELEIAIEKRGKEDSYPFHIIGSQVLAWLARTEPSLDERAGLLRRINFIVDQGAALHPGDEDLQKLARDVQKAYLLTSTLSPQAAEDVQEEELPLEGS